MCFKLLASQELVFGRLANASICNIFSRIRHGCYRGVETWADTHILTGSEKKLGRLGTRLHIRIAQFNVLYRPFIVLISLLIAIVLRSFIACVLGVACRESWSMCGWKMPKDVGTAIC